MDEKTRQIRARNKAISKAHRGGLAHFEPRGLGRKGKYAETFPTRQCSFLTNPKKITFRKTRKDGTSYMVSIWKGGQRCPKNELTNGRCLEHLGKEIKEQEDK